MGSRCWLAAVYMALVSSWSLAGESVPTNLVASNLGTASFEFQDPDSGLPLVKGQERVEEVAGLFVKHTEYSDLQGAVAQVEDCRFDAKTLALVHYSFVDRITGEQAEVAVAKGQAQAHYRKSKDDDLMTETFPWTPTSLSGKALPEMIAQHWSELLAGSPVFFELYVPFRLETIGFRAVKSASSETAATIRVEPKNWLIRQVAPAIAFTYDLAGDKSGKPRLTRYEGPSMVDIAGEKNRRVRILFAAPH